MLYCKPISWGRCWLAVPDRNCCGARDLKDLQFFGAKWDLSEYYSEDPFFCIASNARVEGPGKAP